jgi:levansucrase
MGAKREAIVTDAPSGRAPTAWSAAMAANIAPRPELTIPTITAVQVAPAIDGVDLWDSWPLQTPDGAIARISGRELWMALSAPFDPDPMQRHHLARIRLLERVGDGWRDYGNLLPEGFSPGSREWAGSAIYDADAQSVTLFFTAAGRRGEAMSSFEQRVFQTTGIFQNGFDSAKSIAWSDPIESFCADDAIYVRVDQAEGEPGKIKAFRDPAFFKDPMDGGEYLLFTGSLKRSKSEYNGAVGVAKAENKERTRWSLMPPLVTADNLNNELERPHIIFHDDSYYLFWSTQQCTFAPDGPDGPNGLYGMVSSNLFGPYRPLNGSGLVAANPQAEPYQAYSWTVLQSLSVVGFIDYWGLGGRSVSDNVELARQQFGGTFAPPFRLRLDGDAAEIVNP